MFFREFGVVIAAAVLVSGLVSLTLIPMLASRFLKKQMLHQHHEHHSQDPSRTGPPTGMIGLYERSLTWCIDRWKLTVVFSAVILAATVGLFIIMPKGFLPQEDMNMISGQTEAAQGISFTELKKQQYLAAEIARQDPDIEMVMSRCEGNTGGLFLRLKPRSERNRSAERIVADLKPKLAVIPGIKTYLTVPPVINIGGRRTKSLYQYTLTGSNTRELYAAGQKAEKAMRQFPELEDVTSDLQIANPQINLNINRDKAALMGIQATQIESALYDAFGPHDISTIYGADDQYSVLLELKDAFRYDQNALSLVYVRSSNGTLVPLTDFVEIKQVAGIMLLNHSGQLPSVTISFNLRNGYSLSQAVDKIESQIGATLPSSVSAYFQGTAQAFKDSMSGMLLLLLVTILVIYIILGILYEDYIHPITILTALPFAGFGALLSLMVCNIELSLYGFIGIIMLVGIVKKNGIMMIDFAITAQQEGKTSKEAIIQACLVRFRPIMMTTAAAIMAGIPIALGIGGGGESRQPLGVTMVGGLLFSQMLTLFVTPVFYVCLEHLRHKWHRKAHIEKEVEQESLA